MQDRRVVVYDDEQTLWKAVYDQVISSQDVDALGRLRESRMRRAPLHDATTTRPPNARSPPLRNPPAPVRCKSPVVTIRSPFTNERERFACVDLLVQELRDAERRIKQLEETACAYKTTNRTMERLIRQLITEKHRESIETR